MYNRFHRGEWITWASGGGGEGALDTPRPLINGSERSECHLGPGAGIFKQSTGAGNRVKIGLSYRSARLHRQAELILWNRFLNSGSVCTYEYGNAGKVCGGD